MSEGEVCQYLWVILSVTDVPVGHLGQNGVFVTPRVIKGFKLGLESVREIRVSVQVSQFKANHVTNTNVRPGPIGPHGPKSALTGQLRKQKHVGRKKDLDFVVMVRGALVKQLSINSVIVS